MAEGDWRGGGECMNAFFVHGKGCVRHVHLVCTGDAGRTAVGR